MHGAHTSHVQAAVAFPIAWAHIRVVASTASMQTAKGHPMTDLKTMNADQLRALIAQMQSAPAKRLSLKVSTKGALSLYGLGRFPVTLYRGQWERLLGAKDELEAFIATNAALLSVKPEA